MKPAEESG